MNRKNAVITIAVIAAVLLVAYGIGRWVRHARIEHQRQQAAAENKAATDEMLAKQMPGGRRSPQDEQKRREEVRKQRELQMEKVKGMTEEERQKYIEEQVRSTTSVSKQTPTTPEPTRINVAAPAASEPNKTTNAAR